MSCIIGTLFAELDPPCGVANASQNALVIFGKVRGSDERAVLRVLQDRCIYDGPPDVLETVLNGKCPEKGGCAGG